MHLEQSASGRLWPIEMASFRQNLLSGFIIFLIALPLSIGISVASGAPPTAGILSAIVGGILGSMVSGSYVTISGAAAGLIVVILDSVNSLGQGDAVRGFRLTLAAIVVAGILQIGMGLLRAGNLGLAVPINALQGMLASIGVTIMTKQIFVLEGIAPKNKSIFLQIFEIPTRIQDNNLEIFAIGLLCLLSVVLLNAFPKLNKYVPAPLVAVIIGYIASLMVDIEHPHEVTIFNTHFEVGPKFLLRIPTNFSEYFNTPLFENLTSGMFIKSVITICLVASIESVLSTYAVDKLDPLKRVSNLNMDIISKGICNTLLGLIGGLPIISEIVRSSANVANGGTTRWSNFFHGVFILSFILLVPGVLNSIPLTAFAAILIYVGFRLAKPQQVVGIYRTGKTQLLVFLTTIIVTLNTDLLIGIFAGILMELIVNAVQAKGFTSLFKLQYQEQVDQNRHRIVVTSPCVFSNMLRLKSLLEKSNAREITVDFHQCPFVDYSSQELLKTVQNQMALVGKRIHWAGLTFVSAASLEH